LSVAAEAVEEFLTPPQEAAVVEQEEWFLDLRLLVLNRIQ
jgi:hypothetical protein